MRRRVRTLALVLAAPALAPACGTASAVAPTAEAGGPGILFVGNSLTESNDLPGRVAQIAAATGRRLRTSAVTIPGASLADHLADGRALRAIRGGGWDVVSLQQGPSTLPESRAELIASTRELASEVRKTGGRPALLMVWPLPGQQASAVSASYRAAAEATDAILLPAGDAWVLLGERDPGLVLVGPDGFHPSSLGTYAAALAVACALHPEDRAALAGAVSASGLGLDARRRQLLVDSACDAAAGLRP